MRSKAETNASSALCRKASALCVLLSSALAAWGQTTTVGVIPDADAFVRSLAPTSNYGGAGALSVSGAAAVNSAGQQNGLFYTLMRFPMSNVVASIQSALGTATWRVIGCRLVVNEMASPDNAIFNEGVGGFGVFWMASDTWMEGTGTPKSPTTDGVVWNDLATLVDSNLDVSLGTFTNAGVSGQIGFNLALADALVGSIQQGGEVGLHLTAADSSVGFTFNSRNFANTNAEPVLEITASVEPEIDGITVSNGFALVSFATVSNWSYRLQGAAALASSGVSAWNDLLVVPSGSASGANVYQEAVTNRQRFYRLSVSP